MANESLFTLWLRGKVGYYWYACSAPHDVFVSEIVVDAVIQSHDGICVGLDWLSCIPYFMTSVDI